MYVFLVSHSIIIPRLLNFLLFNKFNKMCFAACVMENMQCNKINATDKYINLSQVCFYFSTDNAVFKIQNDLRILDRRFKRNTTPRLPK